LINTVSLEAFAHKLRSPTVGFGVYLQLEYLNAPTQDEKWKAWTAAWESVEKDIPQLRNALEAEFRRLLGATVERPILIQKGGT
jgi:hypothetical protein